MTGWVSHVKPPAWSSIHPAFPPLAIAPLDDMEGQGVQEFVPEGDSWQGIGGKFSRIIEETHGLWEAVEGFTLGGLKRGKRFRNRIFDSRKRAGIQLAQLA